MPEAGDGEGEEEGEAALPETHAHQPANWLAVSCPRPPSVAGRVTPSRAPAERVHGECGHHSACQGTSGAGIFGLACVRAWTRRLAQAGPSMARCEEAALSLGAQWREA